MVLLLSSHPGQFSVLTFAGPAVLLVPQHFLGGPLCLSPSTMGASVVSALLQFRGTGVIHCPLSALGGASVGSPSPSDLGGAALCPPLIWWGPALSLSSQLLATLRPTYLLRLSLGLGLELQLGLVLSLGLNLLFGLGLSIWERFWNWGWAWS